MLNFWTIILSYFYKQIKSIVLLFFNGWIRSFFHCLVLCSMKRKILRGMQLKMFCISLEHASCVEEKRDAASLIISHDAVGAGFAGRDSMTTFLSFKRSNGHARTRFSRRPLTFLVRRTCVKYYFLSATRRMIFQSVIFQQSRNKSTTPYRGWFRKMDKSIFYCYKM